VQISPEPIDPVADRFVANVDTALVEQVFDIAQGQRKSDVHHDRKLDDFGGRLEVAKGRFGNFSRLDA
jgi:hypothetical protein